MFILELVAQRFEVDRFVIIRRLTYECDIPECKNSFVEEYKGYPNWNRFPEPSLPDGWHYFTGYIGMMTNAMICPKHTIKFSNGEVILHQEQETAVDNGHSGGL